MYEKFPKENKARLSHLERARVDDVDELSGGYDTHGNGLTLPIIIGYTELYPGTVIACIPSPP